jgi:hypothetical protein
MQYNFDHERRSS